MLPTQSMATRLGEKLTDIRKYGELWGYAQASHPDKIFDCSRDAVLDACVTFDPRSTVGRETRLKEKRDNGGRRNRCYWQRRIRDRLAGFASLRSLVMTHMSTV